jgi:hypothetical protein
VPELDDPSQRDDLDERLRREAVRVYERYATEVVEAFLLCPWARRARQDGRVRTCVITEVEPRVQAVIDQMDDIFSDARIEVGLILLPRVLCDRNEFRRFASLVRADHEARHAASRAAGPPPLAMAAFHPHAEPDLASAARLVSFLRRTPDPTIQVVRQAALASVRDSVVSGSVYAPHALLDLALHMPARPAAPMPTAERVAAANLVTVERVGVARLQAILDDIRADRDRAYAALSA